LWQIAQVESSKSEMILAWSWRASRKISIRFRLIVFILLKAILGADRVPVSSTLDSISVPTAVPEVRWDVRRSNQYDDSAARSYQQQRPDKPRYAPKSSHRALL
jgi:hypothetical protein